MIVWIERMKKQNVSIPPIHKNQQEKAPQWNMNEMWIGRGHALCILNLLSKLGLSLLFRLALHSAVEIHPYETPLMISTQPCFYNPVSSSVCYLLVWVKHWAQFGCSVISRQLSLLHCQQMQSCAARTIITCSRTKPALTAGSPPECIIRGSLSSSSSACSLNALACTQGWDGIFQLLLLVS